MDNETDYFNDTIPRENDESIRRLYAYVTIPMIAFCTISVTVNILILMSVCWVRRPISPTLHISLSLVGSDIWACATVGIGLFVNSLLPIVYKINLFGSCFMLGFEAFRMGSVYTTIGHLVALAGNHYLGIRKPLQYPALMTIRYILAVEVLLWIVPPAVLFTYFSFVENDGFSQTSQCTIEFFFGKNFRSTTSYVFLASLALMVAIYVHIYLLVRRHQANRNRFRRAGSTYSRTAQIAENQSNEKRNEKALRTTMLIVGSILLGYLPTTIYFLIVCEDCLIKRPEQKSTRVKINAFFNFLLILKFAINSCIYAARMKEIKEAMRKMRYAIIIACCKIGNHDTNRFNCEGSRHFLSRTSTRRSRRTVLCRLNSIPKEEIQKEENFSTNL